MFTSLVEVLPVATRRIAHHPLSCWCSTGQLKIWFHYSISKSFTYESTISPRKTPTQKLLRISMLFWFYIWFSIRVLLMQLSHSIPKIYHRAGSLLYLLTLWYKIWIIYIILFSVKLQHFGDGLYFHSRADWIRRNFYSAESPGRVQGMKVCQSQISRNLFTCFPHGIYLQNIILF